MAAAGCLRHRGRVPADGTGEHPAPVLDRLERAAVRARRPEVARRHAAAIHPAERHRRTGAGRTDSSSRAASPAVLAEISRMEGSWAKRIYFNELMKPPGLERRRRAAGVRSGRRRDRFGLRARLVPDLQQPADRRRRRAARLPRGGRIDRVGLRAAPGAVVHPQGWPGGGADCRAECSSQHGHRLRLRGGVAAVEFAARSRSTNRARGRSSRRWRRSAAPSNTAGCCRPCCSAPTCQPSRRAAACWSRRPVGSDFEAARAAAVRQEQLDRGPAARRSSAPPGQSIRPSNTAGCCRRWPRRSDSVERPLELLRSAQGISSNFERAQVLLAVASTQRSPAPAATPISTPPKARRLRTGPGASALVKNERRSPGRYRRVDGFADACRSRNRRQEIRRLR